MNIILRNIKHTALKLFLKFKAYIKHFLFPLYLFPIKLITYSFYYLLKFLFKLIAAFLGLIFDCIRYPFKSLKNFLKSIVYIAVIVYLFFSLLVIADYLNRNYGQWNKFWCSERSVQTRLKKSVVRIVGGEGEGSGFFVNENQVLTNFHVIEGEPSPKIILPDGTIETPFKITGDSDADLALLSIENKYPDFIYLLPDDEISFSDNEPVLSAGYALGSDIKGAATIVRGNIIDYRTSKSSSVGYIQTNISLVEGMSGGPLVDQCGSLVGVNTMGLAGLSLFIGASDVSYLVPSFTDQDVEKIDVDPSISPEDAVYAFYTYLKARRMQDGFNLLSQKYLEKTNFEEWTARFANILDVSIYKSERYLNTKDTAFVKFSTGNWVDGELEWHFYEGTWKTVKEEGVYNADGVASFAYKMLQSKIKEVFEPAWDWFYQ